MIYTVTLNPAVDYVVHMDDMKMGGVNRSGGEEFYIGGKGINVSLVLRELGLESRTLGFVAGFTGAVIEQGLRDRGIETNFVHLKRGFSRINVKMKADAKNGSLVETDVNGQGPDIPAKELEEFFRKIEGLEAGDTLILSGSTPQSLPADIYERILGKLSGRGVRTVVDAAGELLVKTLQYRPFLVKPNDIELGEIFGIRLDTTEKIAEYAGRLKEMGAVNVLVSRAGEGAVLMDETGALHVCGACRGAVKNSVGAGDSMVAGFVAGCMGVSEDGAGTRAGGTGADAERSVCDYEYALRLGTAAGGATAFSEGLAKREDIFGLLREA